MFDTPNLKIKLHSHFCFLHIYHTLTASEPFSDTYSYTYFVFCRIKIDTIHRIIESFREEKLIEKKTIFIEIE